MRTSSASFFQKPSFTTSEGIVNIMISLRFCLGVAISANFCIFWAFPIMTQGLVWKNLLKPIMMPIYNSIDENPTLREFAATYIYSKPQYSDFFAISAITFFTSIISFTFILYWQLHYGTLSWWLIMIYYFCWVGFGGRIMGASYALAHKEVR